MLELRNIVKDYVSGNNVTHALRGISVTFRKNEFVSILGASGCGKTTLLNIIGGLDRYTSGDLLILGKSTKEYKDRDWDTYRNHSIGFVFQTYNLIAHQNILKNVELALTISGVSKEERKERAYKALKTVGLEGMEKKKPNQLSGGQCQRVAIARALINNPEILLADEPTGALDSETSVQIMDLLKEVASDRLVIMVTHNPELANKYSTRIINMSDGLLVHDSMPFDAKGEKAEIKAEQKAEAKKGEENPEKGKKKKTSMSLWTSIGLSTSNLLSKMKRTVLVTIAGSIGIIGVSAVLAASRGMKDYIADLQNDMLSAYPLKIAEESVDYTALMSGMNQNDAREHFEFDPKDPKVGVDSLINYLMSAYSDITNVKTNTIDEKMMAFLESDELPKEDIGAITYNYGIDPTNNIFGAWSDYTKTSKYYSFNGVTQAYIAELKTLEDFGTYASFVDLFTSFMHELPDNNDYIMDQYEVVAGKGYSDNVDDLVLVVDQETTLTDVLLAQLGIFDHDSFLNVALCAMHEQEKKKEPGYEKLTKEEKEAAIQAIRDTYPYSRSFTYDQIINRDFYYFPQETLYKYDSHVADDEETFSFNFRKNSGGDIDTIATLQHQKLGQFNFLYGTAIMNESSDINVKNVLCIPRSLFFGGKEVKSENDLCDDVYYAVDSAYLLDNISHLMTLMNNYDFLTLKEEIEPHYAFTIKLEDHNTFKFSRTLGLADPTELVDDHKWTSSVQHIQGYSYRADASSSMIENYNSSANKGTKMRISSILRLKEGKRFGSLSRGLYYSHAFSEKFLEDSNNAKAEVTKDFKTYLKTGVTTSEYKAYVTFSFLDRTGGGETPSEGYASSLNGDLQSSFSDIFASFMNSGASEANNTHFRSLCGLKPIVQNNDYEHMEFKKLPREISFYPKTFEAKDRLTKYLDRWNSDEILTLNGVEYSKANRDDISYTDTISLIAAVVNTFIDAITVALIVFTSLSLVVSCFMIAVITYISVVERIKEIGVIRSLGGRKGDVAALFIMETFMTGLFSGVFGIAMTYVLQLIVNAILSALFGIAIIHLTIPTALLMVGISVGLSVLSGLIPSQSAAHKDPVVALRSNE